MPDNNDMKNRQNNPNGKHPGGGVFVYFIFFLIIMVLVFILWSNLANRKEYLSDRDALKYLQEGSIEKLTIDPVAVGDATSGDVVFTIKGKDGEHTKFYFVSNVDEFRRETAEKYPEIDIRVQPLEEESIWVTILPYAVVVILGIVIMTIILRRMGGGAGGGQMMNFGKSHAQLFDKKSRKITFKDVAGCVEEKEEMKEVVEFLQNPARFNALGARIPKGVLLVGPPGTGKTYLARAVAGEAGVPFYSISGSDFVEMFVGVGASRVRDLFDTAKQHTPCIVFIDEIDAVGRRRGTGLGGGHDEREQTLNQLLVEMDGFTVNQGIIVMAATNRVDILDPALLRPGRFDRQIVVNRPDYDGRLEVLNLYAKNKPMASDVDLEAIAKLSVGFTPSDLENLLNEAAILAGRAKRSFIRKEDIQAAFIRVGVGAEKKSRRISEKEKKITAYHELGHAILHIVLPELDPVHVVSVIPTGMAGGYTMPLPQEDRMYVSRNYLKAEMAGLLGGRVAEDLIFHDVTSGASNDLMRVSEIARSMVTKYGMSENLGPIQFGEQDEEIFLGKEIGHSRNYGDTVADVIDREVKSLVDEAEQTSRTILTQYMDVLHEGAALLIEKEKISGAELEELIERR